MEQTTQQAHAPYFTAIGVEAAENETLRVQIPDLPDHILERMPNIQITYRTADRHIYSLRSIHRQAIFGDVLIASATAAGVAAGRMQNRIAGPV